MSTSMEQAMNKASQAAENKAAAPVTPAAQPTVVKVNTSDALAIGEAVLSHLGRPAHHTLIHDTAKAMGLNPSGLDIATRIWSDTKKDAEKSKFLFIGKSCYALKTMKDAEGKLLTKDHDASPYVPSRARATNSGALTTEQLEQKVARLKTELAAAEGALKAKREGTAQAATTAPKPVPTAPKVDAAKNEVDQTNVSPFKVPEKPTQSAPRPPAVK